MGHDDSEQTSEEEYTNSSSEYHLGWYHGKSSFIFHVVTLTVAGIGIPLTLAAIIALCLLIRKDHVAPIYIINLLIANLLQFCSLIILGQEDHHWRTYVEFWIVHIIAVLVSVCFITIISLERYLMIAWPLWYKFRQSIKTSVIVSVVVWLVSLLFIPILVIVGDYRITITGSLLLVPLPLLIFFLGGSLKALSAVRGVPPNAKRRIVAVLVLVLLFYTLLFLPRVIFYLSKQIRLYPCCHIGTVLPLWFSPLADLFLYIYMQKGVGDELLACLCCCKMDHDDVNAPVENGVATPQGS